MISRRLLALAAAAAALHSSPARAGPWLPGAWHFYLELRESFQLADRRFDASGSLAPVRAVDASGMLVPSSFRDAQTSLYGELGVATRLAALVELVGVRAVWQPLPDGSSRGAVGASALTLGAKLLLFDDQVTAALIGRVIVPLGATDGPVPLDAGDLRADLVLSVGKLFEERPFFVAGELGVRLNSSADVTDPVLNKLVTIDYAPEILFAAQAGYTFLVRRRGLERAVVMVQLEGRYGTAAPVEDGRGSLTPPSARFIKVGPMLAWAPLRHFEIHLGASVFAWGRGLPMMIETSGGVAVSY